MGMEIRYDEIEIFRNNISTLKKTSLDDENTVKQYMTDAEVSVIHFDRVKKAYVRSLEPKPKFLPCSSDALYIGREGSVSFIEFKNGKINDKQKQGQTGTRQKEQCFNMGNAREKVNDKLDNLVSIDEKRQADNNHNTK